MTLNSETLTPALKSHAAGISGSVFAWFGVITVNQQQVEFWLKVVSFLAAILASGFTIWGVLRRERREARQSSKN